MRLLALLLACPLPLLPACAPASDAELSSAVQAQLTPTSFAQQAQLVPVGSQWGVYELSFPDGRTLAQVLVTGDEEVDGYEAKSEYWFVNPDHVDGLGELPLLVQAFTGDEEPPDLKGPQKFVLPRDVPWEPQKPFKSGKAPTYASDGVFLRIESDQEGIVRLTWCQSTDKEPKNIALQGPLALVSTIEAAPGEKLYCIDQLVP